MTEEPSVVSAYISAGSNIEPQKNLLAAMEGLRARLRLKAVSTVYRTPAIGRPQDPDFMNCVFQVETAMPPRVVKFEILRPIEEALGRKWETDRYAPRTIDLDLIIYGDRVLGEPDLILPHPDLYRWFVRVPLLELDSELVVPGTEYLLAHIGDVEGSQYMGEPVVDVTTVLRRKLEK